MIDPIVDEVRKYRNNHAKKFNYDMHAICADLMASQGQHGHTVVKLNSQKMPTKQYSLKNAPHF
jgi:hypothetical protein